MRRPVSLFVAVFVCLGMTSSPRATEWWVDQSASVGGDGSEAAPFRTIGEARNVLHTGDTIWIRDGLYVETVDFWHVPDGTGGRTYVRAASGNAPVIQGDGSRDFVFQAGETPKMTFQGLTVRDSDGSAFHFYHADEGEVIDCVTRKVGNAVAFYFSKGGRVFHSDLEGGVSGKDADDTVIEACRVFHSSGEGITLHADSSNLRYLNNVVYDNHAVNIYLDSCYDVVVDGNLVYMTNEPPSELAGIQMADESYDNVTSPVLHNIVITNNILVNNFYGIVFWRGHFPGQSAMKNVLVANNTVVNNLRLAMVWDAGPHEGTIIRNNIFASDAGSGYLLNAKSTDGVALDHNLWYMPGASEIINWGGGELFDHDRWASQTGQGAGDVLADPGFEGSWDLAAASYRLTASSPAIDTGAEVAGLEIDFDRALRPAGEGYDIGAYEYGAPPNPDGGVPPWPDGGVGPVGDGGTSSDAGLQPDHGGHDGGCGCRSGGSGGAPWGVLVLGCILFGLRRRRRNETGRRSYRR